VARDVIDPNSRRSLFDTWEKKSSVEGAGSGSMVENELGSGSDYTVFLNFLGVPIVSMAFTGPYGVYHSQYDDLYWMEHFGDPGYRYMTAMVEVWGRLGLRLANADVIPYDFRSYASTVRRFVDGLRGVPGLEQELDLAAIAEAVDAWDQEAHNLLVKTQQVLAREDEIESGTFADLNTALLAVERQLLLEDGIPDRPWFKHALYAPRYTYAAMSLPGVREAAEAGNWELARSQLEALVGRLRAAAAATKEAAALVPTP
jgi:N-acetylated-alpha-linked acidic dipeptidase